MIDKQAVIDRIDYRASYKSLIPSLKDTGKGQTLGLCPFHDDHNPSLSVDLKEGLYNCFSCGAKGDVFKFYQDLKKVDFKAALTDIAAMSGITDAPAKQKVVATYEYRDVDGKALYIKERLEPGRNGRNKEFRFKSLLTGKNERGCDPVLYNLPELIKPKYALIVEGEGKADHLKKWGLMATCMDSGASSPWKDEYIKLLNGKEKIVILPDNDAPGRAYASKIANALHGKVGSLKVVELPGLQEAEDIIDWSRMAGNDKERLTGLIKEAPEWNPLQDHLVDRGDTWEEPIPLDKCSSLPEFPVDTLPEPGREMVKVVSEVTQVDPGITGSIYLSVLSASLAKKGEVDLITHKEPLNIYTCSILGSGNRKSGTMKDITKPIYDYQAQKQEDLAVKVKESMSAHKVREMKLANLQKEAAQADNIERIGLEREAAALIKEMSENPVLMLPTYIVDDITTEAQGGLMAGNDERIGVFSTEGGIFGIMAGRYNDKNRNFDLYLKGHAGDPWSCHRVGREPQTMKSPAITMCLTIQDDVIEEIGKNAQFKGRGLLARPLYAKCTSRVGYRERQFKSIPGTLSEQYRKHIFDLMDIPLILRTLKLTEEAQAQWDEFYNDIEREMRKGGSLEGLEDWGSKLPGAVARIAGLLHFAEHGDRVGDKPISITSITASCVIGAYYKEHAIATFGMMREDPRVKSARKILEYILRLRPATFKGCDVMKHTNLKSSMDDVLPGLNILMERGYIREIEKTYSGKGRPEAATYEVNPKLKI